MFYTDWFRNITRGIYAKYQSLQNMPLPIQSFLKKIAKTLDNGKVYSRMWHWWISVKTMLSVRSFLRRGLFVSWGDWGGKKESARPTSPRCCYFFDYGYQAGNSADEKGECDNRGAEMIWNKCRTLFIQVIIALVARLIITLTLKSEGDIRRCYRSNQTSLVKRLHSTTYFLHFTKRNLTFHVNFFRPPSGLLGVRGLKF